MGFSSLLVNYSNEKRFNNFKPIASDAFPFVESRPIILGSVFSSFDNLASNNDHCKAVTEGNTVLGHFAH